MICSLPNMPQLVSDFTSVLRQFRSSSVSPQVMSQFGNIPLASYASFRFKSHLIWTAKKIDNRKNWKANKLLMKNWRKDKSTFVRKERGIQDVNFLLPCYIQLRRLHLHLREISYLTHSMTVHFFHSRLTLASIHAPLAPTMKISIII